MGLLQKNLILPLRLSILIQSSTPRVSRQITLTNTRSLILRKMPRKMILPEKIYRTQDKMPPTSSMIYNNRSAFYIEPLHHIQNFAIFIGSVFICYLIKRYIYNEMDFPIIRNGVILIRNPTEIVICATLTTIILIIGSLLCKFTTLRIYYDQSEKIYKAIVPGWLPFSRKVINIKPRSVIPVKRFFVENSNTIEYQANGHKLLLYGEYFRTPADMHRMILDYD